MYVIRDDDTGKVVGCVGADVQTFKGTVPVKRATDATKGEVADRPVIANLATAPAARRRGLAKKLMARIEEELVDWDRQANGPGPVESRLGDYGAIRALVFGPRGESSSDVTRLISLASEIGGERRWRQMGARSRTKRQPTAPRHRAHTTSATSIVPTPGTHFIQNVSKTAF